MSLQKRIGLSLLSIAFFASLAVPAKVSAATAPVLISEIQTGSSTSASEEFIELHNISDQTIDLSTYKIEYYSATATAFYPLASATQTITLSGLLYPGGNLLAASNNYLTSVATISFSSTLADAGGALRLTRTDTSGVTSTEDVLGWGTAKLFETTAHTKPGNGKSLSRKTVDGLLSDTNNNVQDFDLLATPTPDNTNIAPPAPEPTPAGTPPVEDPAVDPAPIPEPAPSPETTPTPIFLPLSITEILPNPASPATDDADEFVELYNPNEQEVSLSGYKIETGSNYTYHYVFSDGSMPAHGFLALFSKDTNLTLSNSGGSARVLDPAGVVVYEISPYEDANDGEAWAFIDGAWKWTLTPTPGAINVLRLPVLPAVKVSNPVVKAKTTKATTSTKPKATTAKTASAKKTTAAKVKAASTTSAEDTPLGPAPLHPSVLVGVGILALLYAAYEYRGDIRSLVLRFQRYRDLRRNSG